jgi:aspartyl-tRNA(Asn)/glutamyl-tRNA(Gln) amidotransferase subunit A
MLRNPTMINFLDGCALSVPCHVAGSAPVGLMIAGGPMTDAKVLSVGLAIEQAMNARAA